MVRLIPVALSLPKECKSFSLDTSSGISVLLNEGKLIWSKNALQELKKCKDIQIMDYNSLAELSRKESSLPDDISPEEKLKNFSSEWDWIQSRGHDHVYARDLPKTVYKAPVSGVVHDCMWSGTCAHKEFHSPEWRQDDKPEQATWEPTAFNYDFEFDAKLKDEEFKDVDVDFESSISHYSEMESLAPNTIYLASSPCDSSKCVSHNEIVQDETDSHPEEIENTKWSDDAR